MASLLSALVYVFVFIPIWFVHKVTGTSRFERQFHHHASAWDRPVSPARRPQPQPSPPRTAVQGG